MTHLTRLCSQQSDSDRSERRQRLVRMNIASEKWLSPGELLTNIQSGYEKQSAFPGSKSRLNLP